MPSVLIEVRKRYTREREIELIDAVHGALCDAFQILPGDRNVRLVSHEPHRFAQPPAMARPELYTLINIEAFKGRSVEAKRQLYRCIVSRLETLGIPKDHTKVILREVPRENWGIRGGQAACDVDLGYKVDV